MSVTINGTTGIDAVQSGTVDLTTDVTGVLPNANGGTGTATFNTSFKNRIINGAMMIDQRNAGAAVTGNAWAVDRFRAFIFGIDQLVLTTQQDTSAPAGFVNSYKATVTTAETTFTDTEDCSIIQLVEGNNIADLGWGTANASAVTLSFWVRSSLTGTFGGCLQNNGGTYSYPFSYTISVADTWEYKTIIIEGETTGTWLTTNGIGVRVNWSLGSGVDRLGTAGAWVASNVRGVTGQVQLAETVNATWQITGVQLEKGSTATSFDYRPYGTELQLCQRYYQNVKAQIGCAATTTSINGAGALPVTMRDEPSIGKTSGTFAFGDMVSVLYTSTSTPTLSTSNNYRSINFLLGGFTGLTQYRSYRHEPDATYVALFTVSAEL